VKLLFAVGDVVSNPTVPAGVETLMQSASEIRVLSPSRVSRIQWLTGEVDESRTTADERLDKVLGELCEQGLPATGVRGDELPRTAFADAVTLFSPDHILIALSQVEHAAWQRHNLIDHVIADHGLPVTAFVL
jgi:hypothetical protein